MSSVPSAPARSFDVGDVYYLLFRHKWKILVCALLGISAAAAVWHFAKPPYRSVAKLFVRFVISEGRSLGPNNTDATAKSPDQRGETIMSGEKELLTSGDLARQVAEGVGPEKILAKEGGGNDIVRATGFVREGLSVTTPLRSSVIHLAFEHHDPEVVQTVLREIIDRYLKLHVATHRATGSLGDSLTQETDQLRARLAATEEELRKANARAGVVSVEHAKRALSDQLDALRQQLLGIDAEMAERTTILAEMTKSLGAPAAAATPTTAAPAPEASGTPPDTVVEQYGVLSSRIGQLRTTERELLVQFTPTYSRVQDVRAQLADAEQARKALLDEYPALARRNPTNPTAVIAAPTPATPVFDAKAAHAQISALHAKQQILTAHAEKIGAELKKLDEIEGTIVELKRRKELEEANYRYFAASLEQSRINEALGTGRVTNINTIQAPSSPFADRSKINKIILGIAASGLLFGLVWAAAVEFYFDRTVRRPGDVERQLMLPLFLTIPLFKKSRALRAAKASTETALAATSPGAQIEPGAVFHETLRDRLLGYFESRNLTHKPKLIGLAGLAKGAGVTTTAAGLARSLSETGAGNVLLIDMTAGQGSSRHFVKGEQVCDLDQLFDDRGSAHVQQNLYIVRESRNSEELSRNLPQRFMQLVPKLKASDFDYIIFDLPLVSPISITPRMASFMDILLLVLKSEQTDRDVVHRATELLTRSRAHVGVVLNQAKGYVPSKLHQEFVLTT